jgi:SAM-dependent methyltransferase
MRAGTLAVLSRAGVVPGVSVLDFGCGSGDVTVEIARIVGADGRVVGIDIDAGALACGRSLAGACGVSVEWRQGRAEDVDEDGRFDVAYARFLLSHLPDPLGMLRRMQRAVRPGGWVAVEDIDITCHAYWPASAAMRRYIELYSAVGRLRGVDPSLGPRLAAVFLDAGLADVSVSISMPVFREGDGKTIARLTLSAIADAAIAAGLTDRAEVDRLLAEIEAHEADPRSIQSTAQVFQVIGRRPDE